MNPSSFNFFDIEKVQNELNEIPALRKKRQLLKQYKNDFLQQKIKNPSNKAVPFDQQIDLELGFLDLVEQYTASDDFNFSHKEVFPKLKVNVPTEVIANVFKTLLEHTIGRSKPYLAISPFQMTVFLLRYLENTNQQPFEKKVLYKIIMAKEQNAKQLFQKYQNLRSSKVITENIYYTHDIEEVKKAAESFMTFETRMLFLYRILTNYMQHMGWGLYDPFLQQMHLEIAKEIGEYKSYMNPCLQEISSSNRIKLNGPVNVLMTFFYELLVEFPIKYDITYFQNSKEEVIDFILLFFEHKNGKNLSKASLRTMLTPSKGHKRCTMNKRVAIQVFLSKEK